MQNKNFYNCSLKMIIKFRNFLETLRAQMDVSSPLKGHTKDEVGVMD